VVFDSFLTIARDLAIDAVSRRNGSPKLPRRPGIPAPKFAIKQAEVSRHYSAAHQNAPPAYPRSFHLKTPLHQ